MTHRLDLVIPGAQKAGTSTLLAQLGQHPGVVRHATDEFGPLLDTEVDLHRAVAEGFPPSDGRLAVAKAAGLMHHSPGLQRLVRDFPSVRLLVMLREPVSRAYSAYWFARRTGDETLDSFERALAADAERLDVAPARRRWVDYLGRSHYLESLREMSSLVGHDRLKVVLLEDLASQPDPVHRDIQQWLSLEEHDLVAGGPDRVNAAAEPRSATFARALRTSTGPLRSLGRVVPQGARRRVRRSLLRLNERPLAVPTLDPDLRTALRAQFAEHDEALAREFGLDLTPWGRPPYGA